MTKPTLLLVTLVTLIGSGCATTKTMPLLPQAPNPLYSYNTEYQKKITWCEPTPGSADLNDPPLWISEQSFSGMVHEPTIHHVCAGSVEQFSVFMGDRKPDGSRTGYFVLPDQPQAFVFGDVTSEPTVTFPHTVRTKESNRINITIDAQEFTYDPIAKQFFVVQ